MKIQKLKFKKKKNKFNIYLINWKILNKIIYKNKQTFMI